MTNDPSAKRDEALSFLMAHDTGILATASHDGSPHARTVYYSWDDAFNVYFITLANTRKVAHIQENPKVAFVVSEAELPRTLQIEGDVEDLTNNAGVDPALANLVNTLMSNTKYGAPLGRFDTATLKFYRIKPTWVRWGNFLFGQGTDNVLTQIDPTEEKI